MGARALIDARADNQITAIGLGAKNHAGVAAADMAARQRDAAAMIGFLRLVPPSGGERALQHFAEVHVFQFLADGVRFALVKKVF